MALRTTFAVSASTLALLVCLSSANAVPRDPAAVTAPDAYTKTATLLPPKLLLDENRKPIASKETDEPKATFQFGEDFELLILPKVSGQEAPSTETQAPAQQAKPAIVEEEIVKQEKASTGPALEDIAHEIEALVEKSANGAKGFAKKDHAVLAEYYAERDFQPLWLEDGRMSKAGLALIKRLSQADEDGLNASDYTTIKLGPGADAKTAALADYQISKASLRYARHAQAGRVVPSSVSRTIKLTPNYPDPAKVIQHVVEASDKAAALDSYNPTHPAFKALRSELAKLRNTEAPVQEAIIEVPAGKTMYKGYRGARVAVLRKRLNIPTLDDENPNHYDATVKQAVRAFQSESGLIADGLVGKRTLAVLNGDKAAINRIPDLIANMERWRWMARDLGRVHIMANVPSFDVSINRDNKSVHRTRTVVGKTRHKTPIFSDKMEHVVVNPYWNVPYSIASKELLPRIKENPGYVSSRNYEILRGSRVVNAHSVNWSSSSFRKYRIRQRPGSGNALGAVKFLFPNKYSIYFHDTPSKSLFQRTRRAYSHGCVRIHNPFDFGDALMREAKGWRNGQLESLRGSKERWVGLKDDEQIPVHITYFTAIVSDTGEVSYKSDVYGHNARLKQELGLI